MAASSVHVYCSEMLPQLNDLVLFGDNPGGEGQVLILSKQDGIIRMLVPESGP